MRYLIALGLLVLGVAGLAGYPLTPHPDPAFVTVRSGGASTAPGVVEVAHPGTHAIWSTGSIRPCRVSTADGAAVTVDEPRLLARWVSRGEDDAVYTRIATFEAPRAGAYEIRCAADPAAPGASYSVSERPDLRLAVTLVTAGAVAVIAALALAVLTFLRARRAARPPRTMV